MRKTRAGTPADRPLRSLAKPLDVDISVTGGGGAMFCTPPPPTPSLPGPPT